MQIGNVQEFMQGQMSKVKMRQEQEKQIKKAIYQMHVMVESQAMETLDEESKKRESGVKESGQKEQGAESEKAKQGKTDAKTEMEKMLSTARRIAAGNV